MADGYIDLFVGEEQDSPGGQNKLYRGDGQGGFVAVTSTPLTTYTTFTKHVAWVDFNNDGYLDAIAVNAPGPTSSASTQSELYENQHDGTFVVSSASIAMVQWGVVAALADYDLGATALNVHIRLVDVCALIP